MLKFTNLFSSIDKLLDKYDEKKQKVILLLLSAFSSNFEFDSSDKFNFENFYNNGFLMTTINIISLISVEILLIILFINPSFSYFFPFFILTNFFVFIWIFQKLIDIYFESGYTFLTSDNLSSFGLNYDNEKLNLTYKNKINISKVYMVVAIFINFFISLALFYFFNLYTFLAINIFFLLIFIELIVLTFKHIATTGTFSELTFYNKVFSGYRTSVSHLFYLFLSLMLLKTNAILYDNLINVNSLFDFRTFLILIIFTAIIAISTRMYTFIFIFIFPLVLAVSHNNPIIFSLFLSFSLIIYYYNNIDLVSGTKNFIQELIIILIGGFVAYSILIYTNIWFAYTFVLLFVAGIYFVKSYYFIKGHK